MYINIGNLSNKIDYIDINTLSNKTYLILI